LNCDNWLTKDKMGNHNAIVGSVAMLDRITNALSTGRWLAVLGATVAFIVGCYPAQTTRQWEEDVELGDGTLLTIDRSISFDKIGCDIGDSVPCYRAGHERLAFTDPYTGRNITWQGVHRIAAHMDRVDGQYVLIARQTACNAPADKGQPKWLVYVWTTAGWGVATNPRLTGRVLPSLAIDAARYKASADWVHLSIADKRHIVERTGRNKYSGVIDLDDHVIWCT
jgi:hypothetical protein